MLLLRNIDSGRISQKAAGFGSSAMQFPEFFFLTVVALFPSALFGPFFFS